MASRHSTGVTYSLARNSCLSTSMRLECAICGRGAEFPRASARRCLTFPHSVYSAHLFSSRSFSSPTRCTGFADSPPVEGSCQCNCFIMGNCRPASIRFMVSVTRFSHCTRMNDTRFRWTLQYIFVYTAGPSTLQESSSSDSELSAFHARWRQKISGISLNSEMNFFITVPTTSTRTQARTRIARMGVVGTLNQSTSRDGPFFGIWRPAKEPSENAFYLTTSGICYLFWCLLNGTKYLKKK